MIAFFAYAIFLISGMAVCALAYGLGYHESPSAKFTTVWVPHLFW